MISAPLIICLVLLYCAVLFAVAYYADHLRRRHGYSLLRHPWIYTLSIGVFCTSWTYYGSVGRAASAGIDFLPIYLGPTLVAFSWWFVLRKMVRVSREQNISSIADFLSSRYGKSSLLGALVTILIVLGIIPYISLQLQAVGDTFTILLQSSGEERLFTPENTGLALAGLLTVFCILFGARTLDATEHHEGLITAIALESLVKLGAFLLVGCFVTFGLFNGFGDIFSHFLATFPEKESLLRLGTEEAPYTRWFSVTMASMLAVMLLPRQFHVMVLENHSEKHIKKAMWGFPAYLFLINIFVVPIAFAGLLLNNGDASSADYFVMKLPLQTGHQWLSLLAFIGGFSAAIGMVMVESVACATMILNHLIMPLVLKLRIKRSDISPILLNLKRVSIGLIIFLGYFYYNILGHQKTLLNTGLLSFLAVAQLAPATLGALYWRRSNHLGVSAGISGGFLVWFYTLIVPTLAQSGWLPLNMVENGPWGIGWLSPIALFGLNGLDIWSHSLFWSLFLNLACFLAFSLLTEAKGEEQKQANAAIAEYLGDREIDEKGSLSEYEIPSLKRFTEQTLAASVGTAPARIIIDNYLAARGSKMEDIFNIFGNVTLSRNASREQLSVLYEAARHVSSGADLKTIMDNILELLYQQFRFDLCVIRILDPDKNLLTVRSHKGLDVDFLTRADRELDTETCIGTAFVTNSVTMANDSDCMNKPASAAIVQREGIKSFAHAPINVEGQPIGVLSTYSRYAKGIYTNEFIEMFKNLAAHIGIAWRNAQQTQELIHAKEQERELQVARSIQQSLLPRNTPEIPGIELAGTCMPAHQVGGDYYDLLQQNSEQLDMVVADVSGHNVGAALLMAEARTVIQARYQQLGGPGPTLEELNRFFYHDLTQAELFITMFYCGYDHQKQQLRYASAGHNPALILSPQSGRIQHLDAEGMILGIQEEMAFEEQQQQLAPGDILLLYTDGIVEAENNQGELYGLERLENSLKRHADKEAQHLLEQLLADSQSFCHGKPFKDDVTLVVMKVHQ